VETRESEGLPLSGIAIILVLLGAFFLREPPLTGSRPGGPPVPRHDPEGAQRVPARLWQDPVGAVRRFLAAQSGQRAVADTGAPVIELGGLEVEKSGELGNFPSLAAAIERSLSEGRDVTVFGVAIFGGPYAEDREKRLRTRYAVLSALGVLGFVPEDPSHIGYVGFPGLPRAAPLANKPASPPGLTRQPPAPAAPLRIRMIKATGAGLAPGQEAADRTPVAIIPYEWLDTPNQRVLLLWLEEDSLASLPLQGLATLVQAFRDATSGGAPTKERGELRFAFHVPASSGTLTAMLVRPRDPDRARTRNNAMAALAGVSILSPSATASDWRLARESGRVEELKADGIEGLLERDAARPLLARTIATDQALADAVLDELERRKVEIICDELKEAGATKDGAVVCQDHRDHILLIAEWDTFYGRAMPAAFTDALGLRHRPDWLEVQREIPWVHRVSYLRGLDGKLPGEAFSDNKGANNSGKGRDNNSSEAERPVGTGQFDYLRRLAQRVREMARELSRNRRARIAAVGILGSDVYDKLLILQALRPAFPDTVFFTTDLDARLLEPSQFAWTRNLIVASSFGLSLRPELQRSVPPFRDSYQSSRFLSTLVAFRDRELGSGETVGEGQPPTGLPRACLEPRLFEIGRDRAYDISEPGTGGACTRPIHPSLESPPFPVGNFLLSLLATALAGLLLYHYAYPIRERWAYYRLNMPFGARVGAVGVQGFYLLAIGTILMLGVWQSQVLGEPFTIGGGVSIVPTEVLRLLAGLLAIHFSLESWRIISQNNEDLAREFRLESPRQMARRENEVRATHKWPPRLLVRKWLAYRRRSIYHWRNTRRRLTPDVEGRSLEPVSIAGLWHRYQRLGLFRNRFWRALPWALTFMVFSVVLIQLFGPPLIPARGPWNPSLDKLIIIVLTVIPFLLLLIGVVDATRLCIELVRWFVDGRLVWPEATCQTWEERFGMKAEDLREWLALDFIAKRTEAIGRLVYFPFIVIFLMIISRSTYFDGWDMPVGLFVVIVFSALYAVLCAFVLRKTAEQTRQAALSSLQERLTKLAGTDRERESRQLELLMERIQHIRKGAFRPWRQQPVVKALFWFIGGTSIAGLEFFSLYG
jgi:hypothetical protein